MATDRLIRRDGLGPAIHTAFRKAADSPESSAAWRAINDMDDAEWSSIVETIGDWLTPDDTTNPWDLVIDQVVGLATVYGIDHGGPTTPEQVHDLWGKVVVAIAEKARQQGADEETEAYWGHT